MDINMKKGIKNRFLFIMLALLLIVSAGCSSGSSKNTDSGNSNGESGGYSGIVPIYTPGAGGIGYILSAGIGNLFNSSKEMPNIQLVTEATNGSAEIMQFVLDSYKEGKPSFGALAASTVTELYEGNYKEIEGEHPELRGVGFQSYTALHVVVPAKSDIKDFSNLKGKKIGASPGAATTALLMQLLETSYGIGEGDFKHIPIDYAEIQQGIDEGSIDAGLINGPVPSPLVNELESLSDIRVLSVGEKEMEEFLEKYPYHGSRVVEANTYKNQPEDLILPSLLLIYATHEKTEDEIVYNLLKTMLENNEELVDIHPAAKDITEESILDGITVPLHSGAEKYLKEKGIMQ